VRLSILTWNMDNWKKPAKQVEAWSRLESRLDPDIVLLQEAVPIPGIDSDKYVYEEIGERRRFGSMVVAPRSAIEPLRTVVRYGRTYELYRSHIDAERGSGVVVSRVETGGPEMVAISVYGVLDGLVAPVVLRQVADLLPMFDTKYRRMVVLGGDLNLTTQPMPSLNAKLHGAALDAIAGLDLVNLFATPTGRQPRLAGCPCRREDCYHAQTHRHPTHAGTPLENVLSHNDYLFASPKLAERLVKLTVHSWWELSDHAPVQAEFDID
jgi:endonuclease/exonuclease/phosphatase family metal-dependent hydrolase